MKLIINISKIIFIIFSFLIISTFLIILVDEDNKNKICRESHEFNSNYYLEINNVKEIEILCICDKISLKISLNNIIKKNNVNSVILNIIDIKKIYNDDSILELFMENNNLSCIVIIDEEESFDIVFSYN